MIHHSKRGQAALEFLSTYAWAFVIILIVIGALTYFGVTNPQNLLPDRCNLGAEFSCQNYVASAAADTVTLRLQNNAGATVVAQNIEIISPDGYSCTASTIDPWPAGNVTNIAFTSCGLSAAGVSSSDKTKFNVNFDWYIKKDGAAFSKRVQGEVVTTAN